MIRKFIEFAIDKPLLNHILLIFILVLSIFSYINIPKEIFPPMAMDKVIINGGYIGTSADILDKMVVQTIEEDLGNIDELERIQTVIKNGSFTITADIKSGFNDIEVLNDAKDVVSGVKKDLPADMAEPIAKLQTHAFPLVLIALSGNVDTKELILKAKELKTELSKYKSLSSITIRGDADDELLIQLNDQKIRALNLQPSAVVASLKNISSIFPIGTIKEKGKHLYISTYNGEKKSKKIAQTIISVGNKRVKIGDIADVSFTLSDNTELSHYNGVKNISINVSKSKDGNAIALVKKIRTLLKEKSSEDSSINYDIYTDTSIWIKNRLNTVVSNIIFGLILVFIAMMVFINRGIAFVVAIGIPVSFMIGLIATDLLGKSLNMLSLLGALIALGMLVDEAIVVAENIYRHLENGMQRREAAIVGATEMFPAVLTATLTTVFAFLPMLLLSGDMGTFIKIIPIMITVLLLSSLFEAFFFLPLHAQEFLRVSEDATFTKKLWQSMNRFYSKILHFLFKREKISLAVMIISILLLTLFFIKQSKFQLFPEFDTTQIYVYGKVNINNDLKDTEKIVSSLEKKLLNNDNQKDISSITSVIGFKMDAKNKPILGDNLFHIFIDLHERAPSNFFNKYITPYLSLEYNPDVLIRKKSAREIAKNIEKIVAPFHKLQDAQGAVFDELVVRVPGAGVVASDIELSLSSKEKVNSNEGINILQNALAKIDGVNNISNDATLGEKELKLRVNGYGQELGFNEQTLSAALMPYYLKGEYGKMFNKDGLLRIRLESKINKKINSINRLEVQVPSSRQYVALKDIADFEFIQGYVTLNKENAIRIKTVFASLDKEHITSAEVMQKLQPTFEKLQTLGYNVDIKGEEKENNKNKTEMTQSGLIAIFLIFITLVWLFDSIVKSLIVVSTIPLVLLGVFFGFMVMGLNLSMPGMIGIVGLAGVVVNDGLIMVDFIKDAKNTEELMSRAKTRLRPILLTSLTTILGLLTLIFFPAGQAMILQPMAVSLGFGLAWGTVLNLLYLPVLYSYLNRLTDVKH